MGPSLFLRSTKFQTYLLNEESTFQIEEIFKLEIKITDNIPRHERYRPIEKTQMIRRLSVISERYETNEKATMQVIGKMGFVNADVKNISRTGACLEWNSDSFFLQKGDLINVTIQLMSLKRKYNVNAQVVWKVGKRTGVQFVTSETVMSKLVKKPTPV